MRKGSTGEAVGSLCPVGRAVAPGIQLMVTWKCGPRILTSAFSKEARNPYFSVKTADVSRWLVF